MDKQAGITVARLAGIEIDPKVRKTVWYQRFDGLAEKIETALDLCANSDKAKGQILMEVWYMLDGAKNFNTRETAKSAKNAVMAIQVERGWYG
jgi:hypothetical protein